MASGVIVRTTQKTSGARRIGSWRWTRVRTRRETAGSYDVGPRRRSDAPRSPRRSALPAASVA